MTTTASSLTMSDQRHEPPDYGQLATLGERVSDLADALPPWRDRLSPMERAEHDLQACRALGRLDAKLGELPHDVDRFGEDTIGRRLHSAYRRGYSEGYPDTTMHEIADGVDINDGAPGPQSVRGAVASVLGAEPYLADWASAVIAARVETIVGYEVSTHSVQLTLRELGIRRDKVLTFKPGTGTVYSRSIPDGHAADPVPESGRPDFEARAKKKEKRITDYGAWWAGSRSDARSEKEACIRQALEDNPQLSKWSSRELARRIDVANHKLVDEVRNAMVEAGEYPCLGYREYYHRGRIARRKVPTDG